MHYASLMPHIKVNFLLLYDMDKYIYNMYGTRSQKCSAWEDFEIRFGYLLPQK